MKPKDDAIDENEKIEEVEEVIERDADIVDFVELVNCITEYYGTSNNSEISDGDEWKKKTGKDLKLIPEKINKLIEKVFRFQLKRFTK